MLIKEVGITQSDDFEMMLAEFLESGLFDSDKTKSIIGQYTREGEVFKARRIILKFMYDEKWDHRATYASLIEKASDLPDLVHQIDAFSVSMLYDIIAKIEDGQEVADKVIDSWVIAFHEGKAFAPKRRYQYGRTLHRRIAAALEASDTQQQAQTTVFEACMHFATNNNWSIIKIDTLMQATPNHYESVIREIEVDNLQIFMDQMIKFRTQAGQYPSYFRTATDNFLIACRSIENDKNPDSVRLSKLVRQLITEAGLAYDLKALPANS